MIPAGVFNQGGEWPIIYINFNGSYMEDNFPSSPTWPEGYVEYEYRFTTTGVANSLISTGPSLLIPEIGGEISFLNNPGGSNSRLVNEPFNGTVRINRHIGFLSNIILGLSIPVNYTSIKLHFLGIGGGDVTNSTFIVSLYGDQSGYLGEATDTNTSGNSFTPSPYDAGSDWKSTNEIPASDEDLYFEITPLDEFSYTRLNAIAIEIL